MADNKEQIIKWAKYCEQGNCASNECPYHKHENCCAYLIKDLLTLTEDVVPRSEYEKLEERLRREAKCQYDLCGQIVDLKSEVNDLEYKLTGVMHSVDKWLDGDELNQDEVNRAITMREKTLRIVEQAKQEVAREMLDTLEREYKAVINECKCIAISMCDFKHFQKKYIGE